jgi:hypothetical protein
MAFFRSFFLLFLLCSCLPKDKPFSPVVHSSIKRQDLTSLEGGFKPFSKEEGRSDWGKEYLIGEALAKDLDFYRAITSFKRARVLVPATELDRKQQIEYATILTYYLGEKYQQVIVLFEESDLRETGPTFPAFRSLTLMLYDSYQRVGEDDRARTIHRLIERYSEEDALSLTLHTALRQGDIATLEKAPEEYQDVHLAIDTFKARKKSVQKAKRLQAVLPGAGYFYTGQKKSAVTSFIINLLFSVAAYQLFDHGHVALGLITTSLETGWYLGGINGAGLAAKEYNERLYEPLAERVSRSERVIPILSFQSVF